MAIELQNAFSGTKEREHPRTNITIVTKITMKEIDLTGLDEAKTKDQNREEWKNQTLKIKYFTRNFRTNTK